MVEGIATEKLDFGAILELDPGPIFLFGAVPLSSRSILSLMNI